MQHDSCDGCFGASFDTRMWCAGCVDFSRWEDPIDPKDRCKECDAVIETSHIHVLVPFSDFDKSVDLTFGWCKACKEISAIVC